MNNNKVLFFAFVFLVMGQSCVSQEITGSYSIAAYETDQSLTYFFTYNVDAKLYSRTFGDVTWSSENMETEGLKYCLLFSTLDILIPEEFIIGNQFRCKISTVLIEGKYLLSEFITKKDYEVFLLLVERGYLKSQLLYSKERGLLAFRQWRNSGKYGPFFVKEDVEK